MIDTGGNYRLGENRMSGKTKGRRECVPIRRDEARRVLEGRKEQERRKTDT